MHKPLHLGNHTWDNREIFEFIDEAKYLVRPANFPEDNPGKGIVYLKMNQVEVAVINLQGRTFMPPNDCPFQKADELIEKRKKEHRLFLLIFMQKQQVKNKRWDGI